MLTTGPHVRFLEQHTERHLRPPVVKLIKAYRWSTRRLRVLPDFIIIGARKCGTTSLYEYLTQHPCVLPALSKEIYFFDYHYEQGADWYSSRFPTHLEKQVREKVFNKKVITGEATPSYFSQPMVASRIAELLPRVKLLLLLREPIAAAYSAYQFGIKTGTYTAKEVNFERAAQAELNYVKQGGALFEGPKGALTINPFCSLLGRHAYIDLLKPWFEIFGREQLKIILSEDLFANASGVYQEVLEFLGLPEHELESYKPFNENHYGKLANGVESQLQEFFAPLNKRLNQFLGRDLGWNYR
jgi:Sulfotransferase domain